LGHGDQINAKKGLKEGLGEELADKQAKSPALPQL
jgi:hypothetical protein